MAYSPSALPRAAAAAAALFLVLLLAPLLASAESPISLPPASAPTADERLHPDSTTTPADSALAPSHPPSASTSTAAHSPPAPPETSPLPAPSSHSPIPHSAAAPAPSAMEPHSAASAPAPSAAKDFDEDKGNDDDNDDREKGKTPTPAPAAEEIKAAEEEYGETERHGGELNGGKKAGVVVGAFSAAAVVGIAAVVWKKRQANIRRSRYADYSARLELV